MVLLGEVSSVSSSSVMYSTINSSPSFSSIKADSASGGVVGSGNLAESRSASQMNYSSLWSSVGA